MSRFSQKVFLIISVIIIFAFSSFFCSSAEKTNVEPRNKYMGKGEYFILGNPGEARKQALNLALKDALQKGIGVYISTKSEVTDGQSTINKILTESEGHIEEYKILKEGTLGGLYQIELEAYVNQTKLENSFSGRINKIVSKTPFGPCSIGLNAILDANNYLVKINCIVNDISIDKDSILVSLGKEIWEKPNIIVTGIGYLIQFDWKDEEVFKNSDTIIRILRNNRIEFQFKDPQKNKISNFVSNFSKVDFWNLSSGEEKEEGVNLEWNHYNEAKIKIIRQSFANSVKTGKTFAGFCNLLIDIMKDGTTDSYYNVSWQCQLKESKQKKMEIEFPSRNLSNLDLLKSEVDKNYSFFSGGDIFVIHCRDNIENKFHCTKDILHYLKNPALTFQNESGKYKLEIREAECKVENSGMKFQQKFSISSDSQSLERCKTIIEKSIR